MRSEALSKFLDDKTLQALRTEIDHGRFPGVDFPTAMKFILTDGIVPQSDLPAQSFLDLESYLRSRPGEIITATELKNQTGAILERVLRGTSVTVHRHGRAIARIIPV